LGDAWRCRQKDIDTGEVCGQLIFKSENEFHDSGRNKIKNYMNGAGGQQGEDHICPYRSGGEYDRSKIPDWDEYYRLQSRKFCVTCSLQYSTIAFNLCPNCFKIRCRECKRLRFWKTNNIRCPSCLCRTFDVIQTYEHHDALIEKLRLMYEKESKEPMR